MPTHTWMYTKPGWREAVRNLKDGMDEYEIKKGYHVRSEEIEKE